MAGKGNEVSRFYASIQGQAGEATRGGSEASGIHAHVRGWNLGVQVDGYDSDGRDGFSVKVTGGSNLASYPSIGFDIRQTIDGFSLTLDGREYRFDRSGNDVS
jgi:ribosomal protein S6E (S10)